MDILVWLHRRLRPLVEWLGIRGLARRCFRALLSYRHGSGEDSFAVGMQNGRLWKLRADVLLRGEFQEFETIEWLRSVLKPGMHAIDVGANVGQMTLEMAHLVGPNGRVLAIEPGPGNTAVLRRHVEANGFAERVTVVEAACSEHPGQIVDLTVFGNDAAAVGSGHAITQNPRIAPENDLLSSVTISVPTTSIDALSEAHGLRPAAIKIDVEGAELQVLRGARQTLASCQPVLRFSFHPFAFANPVQTSKEIHSLLSTVNYHFELTVPDPLELDEYVVMPRNLSVNVEPPLPALRTAQADK